MSTDTRRNLLDATEVLIRTRGYAAFSYADLAEQVSIRKASIHYYFPAKEDLIVALMDDFSQRFTTLLDQIWREHPRAGARLRAYAELFLAGYEKGMLPICGALSAERSALPEHVRPKVSDLFQLQLSWIAGVAKAGVEAGDLRAGTVPEQLAVLLLSTLEGGSFISWALEQKTFVLAAFESTLSAAEAARSA